MKNTSHSTSEKKQFGMGFAGLMIVLMSSLTLALPVSLRSRASFSLQQTQRYELKGIIKAVDKANRRATIQHEKIGDYMDAMTMPFAVKDDKALKEMEPNDQIKGTLVVTKDGATWVEKITIVVKAKKQSDSNAGADKQDNQSFIMGESGDRLPPPPRYGDAGGLFTCPMHLDIRANKAGKCPRCGMELVSTEPEIEEEFDLQMEASPKVPQPGQPVKLRFAIFNPRTGAQVKQFGLMHDKLFHLFLVSQDLNDFQHIHPRQLADGSFVIDAKLKQPGLYKVYTDFYPLAGAPQVLQTHLATAGWGGEVNAGQAKLSPNAAFVKTAISAVVTRENAEELGVDLSALEKKSVGELKVELKLDPGGPLVSGKTATLKYQLTDAQTGEPVRDLIPYLGAWGHMLVLSEDQSGVLHSHPEQQVDFEKKLATQRGGPELTFDVLFPAPGNYRIWTQFLRGRQLNTVAFDVSVKRLR